MDRVWLVGTAPVDGFELFVIEVTHESGLLTVTRTCKGIRPLALPFAHEPTYSGHSARKIIRLCGLQRFLLTGRAQQSTFHQFAMERLKIAFRLDDAPVD